MSKFKRQEKPYSCGASALRNCIVALDKVNVSERSIRLKVGTTKDGTTAGGIIAGAVMLDYNAEIIEKTNPEKFKEIIVEGLRSKKVFIVLSDSTTHWIALVGYENKYFYFVDSTCKRILQAFTEKQFLKMVRNFDKEKRKEYFFAIQINKIIQ